MATTARGLPYPVGTDRVMDGDDAIKALAEALDPPWTNLGTLNAGWSAQGGTVPGYRVIAGIVYLRGHFTKSTAAATGDVIITLPAGARPNVGISVPACKATGTGGSEMARLDVAASGNLKFEFQGTVLASAWFSMDGCSYPLVMT